MKKRIIKLFCGFLVTCTLLTSPILAHSGRTDSNGGHRDNKNKSGLGYYHYHCGGYPAHLHTDGVCPYKKTSSNSSSSGNTTSSVVKQDVVKQTVVEKKPQILATDIKTFIGENEIPTFYYNGEQGETVVIVEDLARYGFDKVWNAETKTLTLTRNVVKVILKTSADSEEIQATKIYNLNGYVAISTGELKHFGSVSWDNTARKVIVKLDQ